MLSQEYKGLPARDKAVTDLKELRRDKEFAPLIKAEEAEQKARMVLLDAMAQSADGKGKKAAKSFEKLVKKYPESRAAKQAAELNAEKTPAPAQKPPKEK